MHTVWAITALLLQTIALVDAHTAFTTLFVNGVSRGDGTCVRMNTIPKRTNFPVADITSNDITCGQAGIAPVARTCPIQAGDTVSSQFRSAPGSASTESIVEAHQGPCAVYMKRMSPIKGEPDGKFPSQSPAGDGWFKIMYNSTDRQGLWCTERLNHTSEGVLTTQIPSDIASGYYLLRPELLALHNATRGDPQFYTGCAQVYISGGSGTARPETVAIPGYVNYSQEAMLWNLYNQSAADYPEYGPKLYKSEEKRSTKTPTSLRLISTPATASAPMGSTSSESSISGAGSRPSCRTKRNRTKVIRNDGVEEHDVGNAGIHARELGSSISPSIFSCPANTILELGNSCLPELPHWLDGAGSHGMPNCWASQSFCWSVVTACWKERSPAVSYLKGQGCNLYADRCTDIGTACKNSVREGPPHEGASIAPKVARLSGLGVQG